MYPRFACRHRRDDSPVWVSFSEGRSIAGSAPDVKAPAPCAALAGAAIGGLSSYLVFPAIGVEAVKCIPEFNRGTALGVYTAFADVSFFLAGPIAGYLIGYFG